MIVEKWNDLDDQAVTTERGFDNLVCQHLVELERTARHPIRIELITADVEVGRIYEGRVARLMDFGAFVTILPGRDGLVHISQISNDRVERVADMLNEGDLVKVKVLEVDRQGRVRLSMKDVEAR